MRTRRLFHSSLLLGLLLGSYELHAASHALSRQADERFCLELRAGHGFATTHMEPDIGMAAPCLACLSLLRLHAPGPDLPAGAFRDLAVGQVFVPVAVASGTADVRLGVSRGPPLV